jgi:conjugal transfer ATP-binding protein TraC
VLSKQGVISFNPALLELLKSLTKIDNKFSEWVVQSPTGYSAIRFAPDDWFLTLTSSKGPVFDAVQALVTQGYETTDAVTEVCNQQRALRERVRA